MSICTQPSHICNLERNSVAEMLLRNPPDSRKDSTVQAQLSTSLWMSLFSLHVQLR